MLCDFSLIVVGWVWRDAKTHVARRTGRAGGGTARGGPSLIEVSKSWLGHDWVGHSTLMGTSRMLFVMAAYCLAACSASLPEWSKNSPLRHAEDPVHHRDEATAGHVDLPVTLQWRTKPMASVEMVAVMMAVASLCMMACACWALIAARRSLGEGGEADGKVATPPNMLETLPLSPTRGVTARGQRISRELFVDLPTELNPAKSHAVSISEPPVRLPRTVSPLAGHHRSPSV